MIWLLLLEVDAPRRDPADRLDPGPIVAQVRQLLTESREAWIQTQIVASDEVEQRTKSAHWRRHHESNMRLYGLVGWTPRVIEYTRKRWQGLRKDEISSLLFWPAVELVKGVLR